MSSSTTRDTKHGSAIVGMTRDRGVIQVNVFHPPAGGAGLFAVFPGSMTDDEAWAKVVEVLDRGPLTPGKLDIYGARAAGAVAMPVIEASKAGTLRPEAA